MERSICKKLTIIGLLLILCSTSLLSRPCRKCRGLGKMTIFHAISTYGLSKDFHECPICHRMIRLGSEHKEPCDACGGTGIIESLSDQINSKVQERNDEQYTEALSYLSSGELAQFIALKELLNGHDELVPCSTCQQSGFCIACKGMRYLGNSPCTLCAGTGICRICGGTKYSGSRHIFPTDQERQEILKQMGLLTGNAWNRGHGIAETPANYSPEQHNGLTYAETTSAITVTVGNNADIYVDGAFKGKGNWTGMVTNGNHRIECKKDYCNTTYRSIDVQQGGANYFPIDTPQLVSAQTTLSVGDNSNIYVDGTYKGSGRWSGSLNFGTHNVECRKKSHRTSTLTINVIRDGSNSFTIPSPTPIYGSLEINSSPNGALVKIDSKIIGYTPLNLQQILIGDYEIEIIKKFFKTEKQQVTIAEKQTTSKSFKLESSVPVTISTTPGNVNLTLNGKPYTSTVVTEIPAGTYNVVIPRQYNSTSVCRKKSTIVIDSLHTKYDIRLRRDFNYDKATFFGIDYDTGLEAIGLNFGANTGKHFMFEMNFLWGIKKTAPIYWTAMKTASLDNYDLQKTEYRNWATDLRMGPTFWCGPFLRISPQVGVQYIKLRESALGESNTETKLAKGGYLSALASMRFRVSLGQNIGIHATPQYKLNVTGKKVLPDISNDIDKWVNGFSVKAGLTFFF